MKTRIFCIWTLFSACSIVQGGLEQQADNNILMSEISNTFAFRLYQSIRKQLDSHSNNVFFSPLSVSLALGALSLGAGGETHEQLFSGLGFNASIFTSEQVHRSFLHLLQNLKQRTGVNLEVGTALYVQNTFKPHPEFLEKMKHFYLSDGFSVDFTKTIETAEQINKYVSEKTHGKINKLVKDLNSEMLMYLLSYTYFKGKWILPFNPRDTKEEEFHVDDETKVMVQMMSHKDFFDAFYDMELLTHVLCLHYNDSFSMVLALPPKLGLDALEKAVSPQHIVKWLRWMTKREYNIFVPKLSLKRSHPLRDILTGMGMKDMFTNKANFTGISSQEKLFVSEAVHQASLDVDEAGATATGVTEVHIIPLSRPLTGVLNFNHPFMIFIVDRQTMSVLFMGRITNPLH